MDVKVGDKFIIEIGKIYLDKDGNKYQIKGFNTLFFDEPGLKRLKEFNKEDKQQYDFRVGDEVKVINRKANDGDDIVFVITRIKGNICHGINKKGTIHVYPSNVLKGTGYHYSGVKLLLNGMEI